jgi:hypothetical protein
MLVPLVVSSAFLVGADPDPDFEADEDDERLPPLAASPRLAKLSSSAAMRTWIPGLAFICVPSTIVQDARLARTAIRFKPLANPAGQAAGRQNARPGGMLAPGSGENRRRRK